MIWEITWAILPAALTLHHIIKGRIIMKKLLSALLFAAVLGLAVNASAAVKEFKGKVPFTVDVPAGWTEQAADGGVTLIAPDASASTTFLTVESGGLNSEAFAKELAKQLKLDNVAEQDGAWVASGKIEGKDHASVVAVNGDVAVIISMTGDLEKAGSVAGSMQAK